VAHADVADPVFVSAFVGPSRMAKPNAVIAGLDPAIHPLRKMRFESYEEDGPAGQARG
jgi:hypothetical protein